MVDGNYGYFWSIEYGKVPKWALLSATRAGQHCSLGVQDAGWRKVLQSGNMLYVAANSGREGNDEASAFFCTIGNAVSWVYVYVKALGCPKSGQTMRKCVPKVGKLISQIVLGI